MGGGWGNAVVNPKIFDSYAIPHSTQSDDSNS